MILDAKSFRPLKDPKGVMAQSLDTFLASKLFPTASATVDGKNGTGHNSPNCDLTSIRAQTDLEQLRTWQEQLSERKKGVGKKPK